MIIKRFINPIRSQAVRILSEKQMSVVSRYLDVLPQTSNDFRVCYSEWQPPEDFYELSLDIDSWYKRLAVTETRMEQLLEVYTVIRQCLKTEAVYLFTGANVVD